MIQDKYADVEGMMQPNPRNNTCRFPSNQINLHVEEVGFSGGNSAASSIVIGIAPGPILYYMGSSQVARRIERVKSTVGRRQEEIEKLASGRQDRQGLRALASVAELIR